MMARDLFRCSCHRCRLLRGSDARETPGEQKRVEDRFVAVVEGQLTKHHWRVGTVAAYRLGAFRAEIFAFFAGEDLLLAFSRANFSPAAFAALRASLSVTFPVFAEFLIVRVYFSMSPPPPNESCASFRP